MDQQIAQQIGMGTLALVVGVLGWVLPFRWNFLRLKHTPSLPDAHPRSDRFRCGGRESKFSEDK